MICLLWSLVSLFTFPEILKQSQKELTVRGHLIIYVLFIFSFKDDYRVLRTEQQIQTYSSESTITAQQLRSNYLDRKGPRKRYLPFFVQLWKFICVS